MSTSMQIMGDTRYGFTPEQVDVIKATIAPGASNEELALFLMVCQKTGLDPFSRQIYLSERWSNGVSKKTPETTIDGFRVIAERSGKYAGQLGPFWCGPDGIWRDVWIDNDMPSAAKVGILRSDFKEPVWGIALFMEYAQYKKAQGNNPPQLNSMWQKMGANQLAKCAEALGLRKAFPRDLSGMYTREEMAQADKADTEHAKEAQQDVAQRRIKELSAPNRARLQGAESALGPVSPATIIELANSLDEPAEPMGGWQGAAKQDPEMDDPPLMAPDAKRPPKKEKPQRFISEAAEKRYLQAKFQLRAVRQDKDKFYYDALKPYKHCTEIPTKQESERIWKILQSGLVPDGPESFTSKQDKALLLELEAHALRIGPYATKAALEHHGLQSIEEVLTFSGDFDGLMAELRGTA